MEKTGVFRMNFPDPLVKSDSSVRNRALTVGDNDIFAKVKCTISLLKDPQRCSLLDLTPYQITCHRTLLFIDTVLELFSEYCKVVLC